TLQCLHGRHLVSHGWGRDDFALVGMVCRGYDTGHLHRFTHARRPTVTNLELALPGGNRHLARLADEAHRVVVQRSILLAIPPPTPPPGPAGPAAVGAVEKVRAVARLAALLPPVDQPVPLVIGNEGAMDRRRQTGARRLVEHVAVAEQLFGTAVIEDGARVDA